jgi:hypothetical protein
MTLRAALVVIWAVSSTAACGAYFNSMWSANHYAAQARHAERDGRAEEARTAWGMAAVKAESVVSRHPHSRWADDALVLQGEALARSGACDRAVVPLQRALEQLSSSALRERAALAAAECMLARGNAAIADSLLSTVIASPDPRRASRAHYLAGLAAEARGDLPAAAAQQAMSQEMHAGPARARALLKAGATTAALALLDTLTRRHVDPEDWDMLLREVAHATSPDTAGRLLDAVLERGGLSSATRARLLVADGDRWFGVKEMTAAAHRYAQAEALVPDSSTGQLARVRHLATTAARATNLGQLREIRARAARVAAGVSGTAAKEMGDLEALLKRILVTEDASDAAYFEAAELARDTLGAPQIATDLFLTFARNRSGSLFAPKALVAAAALSPERSDSILGSLRGEYPASPYTLALAGEISPAYGAAEDSLAIVLGVANEKARAPVLSRGSAGLPVPGPRGPPLDAPPSTPPAGSEPVRPPAAPSSAGVPEQRRSPRPKEQQ